MIKSVMVAGSGVSKDKNTAIDNLRDELTNDINLFIIDNGISNIISINMYIDDDNSIKDEKIAYSMAGYAVMFYK